jgi:hypothetical protein
MATDVSTGRPVQPMRRTLTGFRPRWSAPAWGSAALGVLFVAVTCWWLSQDGSIPIDDAGVHLNSAISTYEALSAGRLLEAFTGPAPYPPLIFLVGALGAFVGGVGVAPPIIAVNVVFVALLALGCYHVGRLAFGPLAGLLAVVFALGSPLVIEEFHQFMLDAPEAAMVATAVWAILATERFSRPRASAVAGVAVGLGMLSKETFVFFVAGVALVTALRGGRRAWRQIALFAAVALIIALPWYVYELHLIDQLQGEAFGSSSYLSSLNVFPGIAPPRLSSANLEWYFWSFLNAQPYLPLFAFSVAGAIWMLAGFLRRRPVSALALELAVGAFVSWAALTETYVHDDRYGVPILVYLAVLAAGWVSRLPRAPRAVMAAALVLVALANCAGVGFGVGRRVTVGPGHMGSQQWPETATLYENSGIWAGGPTRDGDLLGLLRALRRNGVREVRWSSEQEVGDPAFSYAGITVLARIAGLGIAGKTVTPANAARYDAFLLHGTPQPGYPAPCTTLQDGAGVWVRLGDARGIEGWAYCPSQ